MNREDFKCVVEKTGAYRGKVCRILYKGQCIHAFGTSPDSVNRKRRGHDSALLETAEVSIRQIMAGLWPRVNELVDTIDMEK